MKCVQRVEDRLAALEEVALVRLVIEVKMTARRELLPNRRERTLRMHGMREQMIRDDEVEAAGIGNRERVVVEQVLGARAIHLAHEKLLRLEERQRERLPAVQPAERSTDRAEARTDLEHARLFEFQQRPEDLDMCGNREAIAQQLRQVLPVLLTRNLAGEHRLDRSRSQLLTRLVTEPA